MTAHRYNIRTDEPEEVTQDIFNQTEMAAQCGGLLNAILRELVTPPGHYMSDEVLAAHRDRLKGILDAIRRPPEAEIPLTARRIKAVDNLSNG